VVVARRPGDGLELQASYATPETMNAQAAELRRQFPGAEIEVGGPELADRVVSDRAAASAAPDSEALNYARERQRFYSEEAQSAKTAVARQNAQANADAYASDVARMEGRELHHSELQPRTDAGQFDGPPRSLPARVLGTASDIINAPKSIKSSLALHGPFRQGIPQVLAHPTFLKDAITEQVKAFASEDAFQSFARSVIERPDFQRIKDAGLFLPSTYDAEGVSGTGALMREERFASSAAEKLPGVRRSSRAYMAAMDSLRLSAWDTYTADLAGNPAVTGATDKAVADLINVTTGRGVLPVLDRYEMGRKIVAALNNPLWSPRAMASRFNLLSPYRLVENAVNPATRPVVWLQLRDGMRATATLATTAGLLSLTPGVKVGMNPYGRDFGKVSVGDAHYDLVDGIPATARYAARMASSFILQAKGKRLPDAARPAALTEDFLRRRLSPSGAGAADALTGRTVEGEPSTYPGAARDLVVPFVVEGMYRGWRDAGGSSVNDALDGNKPFRTGFKGAAKGLPGFFGVPSSTDRKRGRSDTGEPFDLSDIVEQ